MRKFYLFMLMAVGLLISGNLRADGNATSETGVAKIGEQYYLTLQNAVDNVLTDGTETKIEMIENESMETKGVTISKGMNVILELNGKVVSLNSSEHNSATITNLGTLTIQDLTDVSKKGEDCGRITYFSDSPDLSGTPGWANNTITNNGNLKVLSGIIENTTPDGTACYAIDNCRGSDVILNIQGGRLLSGKSNAIRMYTASTEDQTITIENAVIKSLWMQDGGSDDSGELIIKNATFLNDILIGFKGLTDKFKFTIENSSYASLKYELKADAIGNNITISNNKDGQFYMEHPKKILKNGIFCFNGEFSLGWVCVGEEIDKTKTEEPTPDELDDIKRYASQGIRIDLITRYPDTDGAWYQGYLSPEAHLYGFYDYIVDGYGLVALDPIIYGNRRFMVAKLKGSNDPSTTPDDAHTTLDDGSLANYWHKNQTWASDEVPQSGDPVVIDHNVIVEKNTTANAASIVIYPNQKLIVEKGATLHIEDAGALFKDETAQMIVNSGAVVTVGANGVIADNTDNIIIKSTETEQGIFMVSPEVSINTEPSATVELYTKCKQIHSNPYEYLWQRFAIPTKDGETTTYKDNHTAETLLFDGGTNFIDAVYGWNDDKQDWYMLSRWKDMVPFKGYQLTNNTADGKITYSFEGNLVGNHDGNYKFKVDGFHFFGNSYTAPIYIASFLESIAKESNGVQASLWIYDVEGDNFVPVTKLQAEMGTAKYKDGTSITEVRSMQAFIMNTTNASATSTLSYAEAIWGNPRYQPGTPKAPARATIDFDMATINITAENGQADQITLIQSNDFSAEYEDGADAAKYMYADGINIYANTNCGQLSNVATDDVDGTILAFKSGKSSEYTLNFDNINGGIFTLVDMQTGAKVEMKAGNEYSFTQTPNTNDEARFMVMGGNKAPTGKENIKANKVIKLINNGQFSIIKNGVRYNGLGVKF